MEINLSMEMIETIYNALRCSKQTLTRQEKTAKNQNKKDIIKYQLEDVEYAMQLFEELMD